jgi:hypothetical protein
MHVATLGFRSAFRQRGRADSVEYKKNAAVAAYLMTPSKLAGHNAKDNFNCLSAHHILYNDASRPS